MKRIANRVCKIALTFALLLIARIAVAGDGLSAVYFDSASVAQARALHGAPKSAIVTQLSRNWGTGAPLSGMGVDTFGARFAGALTAPTTGAYTFRTYSDDGVRVWVDGVKVIDNWSDHAPTYDTSSAVVLQAGQKYSLRVEYYENGGGATVRLEWKSPGATGFAVVGQAHLSSGTRNFPPGAFDANFRSVRDWGAKGDGITDDTTSLQRAVSESVGKGVTLYFPNGTYRLRDRLGWRRPDGTWGAFVAFQGQSEGNTVLRLDDNAPGFDNPDAPRDVIKTADLRGENGGEGYQNNLWDFTVETGRGNPGARGIWQHAHNWTTTRHVTVRSGDGQGLVGYYGDGGPTVVHGLTVEGFRVGIHNVGSGTLWEQVRLRGQSETGFVSWDGIVSVVRDLRSVNSVPAFRFASETYGRASGMLALSDAVLQGGSSTFSAVEAGPTQALWVRNVTAAGYRSVVAQGGTPVSGNQIGEYTTYPAVSTSSTPVARSLNLPVADAPEYHDNDLARWVNVRDFGAVPGDGQDDAPAIQAALDFAAAQGKTTVYFPRAVPDGSLHFWYDINQPVRVHGAVRRLLGFGSQFRVQNNGGQSAFKNASTPVGMWRFEHGGEPLVFEWFNNDYNAPELSQGMVSVEQATNRGLVVRSVYLGGIATGDAYRAQPGAGPLWVDMCFGSGWRFTSPGQKVWMRSVNPESPFDSPQITNGGADLWIMGVKSEYGATVVQTLAGRTEVAGIQMHEVGVESYPPTSAPAYVTSGGSLSVVGAFTTAHYNPFHRFSAAALETRSSPRTLPTTLMPYHSISGKGILNLYTSYPEGTSAPPATTFYRWYVGDSFDDGAADGWTLDAGEWSVTEKYGNYWTAMLVQSQVTGAALASLGDDKWTNYTVQAWVRNVNSTQNNDIGILGRVRDASNFYQLGLKNDNGARLWQLQRCQGGVWTVLAQGPFLWDNDVGYLLRLEMQGSTLTARARNQERPDWQTLGTVTDGAFGAGKIGVRTWNTAGAFDAVEVLAPAYP